jgi:hypothetical protein
MVKSSLCLVIAHALQRASKSSSSVKLQSHNEEDCLAWKSLSLSLSVILSWDSLHCCILHNAAVPDPAGGRTCLGFFGCRNGDTMSCDRSGQEQSSTATAQLRHSYGTASSSREICDDIRNATTNPLAVHSTNKPLLGRKTQLYHHMQLPG